MLQCIMANNLKVETGASDGHSPSRYWKGPRIAKIDLNNDENIDFWASELKISRDLLLVAAKDFGPAIRDIRRGLARNVDEAA